MPRRGTRSGFRGISVAEPQVCRWLARRHVSLLASQDNDAQHRLVRAQQQQLAPAAGGVVEAETAEIVEKERHQLLQMAPMRLPKKENEHAAF